VFSRLEMSENSKSKGLKVAELKNPGFLKSPTQWVFGGFIRFWGFIRFFWTSRKKWVK